MKSNHKAVDFVRQLDKSAMKNCMELALQRHEKDLSVKQVNKDQELDRFKSDLELKDEQTKRTMDARRN